MNFWSKAQVLSFPLWGASRCGQQTISLPQASEKLKLEIPYDKPAAGAEKIVPKIPYIDIWQNPANFNIYLQVICRTIIN